MIKLNIEDGLEEIEINGDLNRVFKFNPADYNIIGKLSILEKDIKEEISKLNLDGTDEESWANILELDKKIKERIDDIFSSNVSKALFNGANCLLSNNGKPVIYDFFEKIAPIIKERMESEMKASEDRVSKYTAKYDNPKAQENYDKLVKDTTK